MAHIYEAVDKFSQTCWGMILWAIFSGNLKLYLPLCYNQHSIKHNLLNHCALKIILGTSGYFMTSLWKRREIQSLGLTTQCYSLPLLSSQACALLPFTQIQSMKYEMEIDKDFIVLIIWTVLILAVKELINTPYYLNQSKMWLYMKCSYVAL